MSMLDFLLAQTAPNTGLAQMGGQKPLALQAAGSPIILELLQAAKEGKTLAGQAAQNNVVKQGALESPLDFLLMRTAGKQFAANPQDVMSTLDLAPPATTQDITSSLAQPPTPVVQKAPVQAPAAQAASTGNVMAALGGTPTATPQDILADLMQAPAQPKAAAAAAPATPVATPAANPSMMSSLGNWFNDPANQRLLLGLGATLGRGGSAAEGFLTGAQMRDQYTSGLANAELARQKHEADLALLQAQTGKTTADTESSKAAARKAGAEANKITTESGLLGARHSADLALTKAQTGKATADAESARASARKALAEANKLAKEANLSKDELEGFRKTYNTNIGEMGGLGDPMASVEATALTAMQELAGKPDSKALQTLLDNSITTLLNNVNGMEIDEAKQKLIQLQNTFGKAKVDAIAQTIMGG